MKSPEESDLYIITPLRYDCTAKSLDRIKTTNVQSSSCLLWNMFLNLIVIQKKLMWLFNVPITYYAFL